MQQNITQKDADRIYKYFEEATIVFKILEEKTDAFNKVAKNFENIERKIGDIKTNLENLSNGSEIRRIEKNIVEKTNEVLYLLDKIDDRYREEIEVENKKNLSLALAVGLTTMVITIVVTGVFIA